MSKQSVFSLLTGLSMAAMLSLSPMAAHAEDADEDDAAAPKMSVAPSASTANAKAAAKKAAEAKAAAAKEEEEESVKTTESTETKVTTAKPKKSESATDYVVLRVNGDEIHRSDVLELWQTLFEGRKAPDFDTQDAAIKKNVLTGLVSEKLALQQADKAGIEAEPAMRKKIDMLRKQVLIQEWMSRATKDKVTDESVRSYYEQKIVKQGPQDELHVRHILVKTPEEAKTAYERLKKGEDFATVAKAASVDKGSSANGGDIGWIKRDMVVPEFAEAAYKLKNGEISKPIKSPFGWHMIEVIERRTRQPQAFAEVKDQVAQEALGQATRDVVQDLLKKADIDYYSASGEKLPFDRSLPSDIAPKK